MTRYSLFKKIGPKWVRMTQKSYFKQTAQMVWFDEILTSILNKEPKRLQKVRF